MTQVLLGILNEQISKAGHEHSDQGKPAAGREKQEAELKKGKNSSGEMERGHASVWLLRVGLVPSGCPASRLLLL